MGSIAVLRPESPFAGVVADDTGRNWVLHVATSSVLGHTYVDARSGAARFGGDLHIPNRFFDDLTPGHGQSTAFIRRIAEHMWSLVEQFRAMTAAAAGECES